MAHSYLATAEESLVSAESALAAVRDTGYANRAHFQTPVAARPRVGVGPRSLDGPWRHDVGQAQFAEQSVDRRQRYPSDPI